MKYLLTIVAVAAGSSACGDPCASDSTGTRVLYDDVGASLTSFVGHPWPSDALLREGGGLRLRHFPNPTESSTLEDYIEAFAETVDAYGPSTATYFGFSGPIDPASFPATVAAATEDGASIFLVDVTPESPEYGRRYPLRLRFSEGATLYLPENHLAALAPFGLPLLGDTTYALVITTDVLDQDGAPVTKSEAFAQGLDESCNADVSDAVARTLAPLRAFISDFSLDPSTLAGGTVFTTHDSVGEVRALVAEARDITPAMPDRFIAAETSTYTASYQGEVELPSFQSGNVPFRNVDDGGTINWVEGVPTVDHYETTRFRVVVPRQGTMPADGWPVILYSHGTGGSFESVSHESIAEPLAQAGFALVGYDQTLHGPRDPTGSDPDITFFNIFNPVAARDNVRQGAVDVAVITNLIADLEIPDRTTGRGDFRFDTNKMGFLGHSQGALGGSLMVTADPRHKAVVFSGLGAILNITFQERKDPLDFSALLGSLLALPETEVLDDFHPVFNLAQMFIAPADPITYARSYLIDPPEGEPRDFLMVEGFLDFASPPRGQEAFSVAAGMPVVQPVYRMPEDAEFVSLPPADTPAADNVQSAAGSITYGIIQYPEEDHFPIFRNLDANIRYVEFLRSALLDGDARIIESNWP